MEFCLGFLEWPQQHLFSWLHDLPEVVSAGLHVDDVWVSLFWSWIFLHSWPHNSNWVSWSWKNFYSFQTFFLSRFSTDLKTIVHEGILGIRINHILRIAPIHLIPSKSLSWKIGVAYWELSKTLNLELWKATSCLAIINVVSKSRCSLYQTGDLIHQAWTWNPLAHILFGKL